MPDVHLAVVLPDGTAVGYDDDGGAYKGTPTEIPLDQMTVTTTVATDGLSFTRTISLPDGTVWGSGILDRADFDKATSAQVVSQTGQLPDQTQLDTAWTAECGITALDPTSSPALTYTWQAI